MGLAPILYILSILDVTSQCLKVMDRLFRRTDDVINWITDLELCALVICRTIIEIVIFYNFRNGRTAY